VLHRFLLSPGPGEGPDRRIVKRLKAEDKRN
jgi:hypothetical protein